MDNLTHSLTGLALARAGLNRFCPHATALLILSANAPDGDIVMSLAGGFRYFEAHRGYSHSLVLAPAVALLSVLIVAAIFRCKLPWGRAWLLALIGVASHLLIDWTNNYGVRFGLPWSSRWFHLDLNSLYDLWILGALAIAALWAPFSRLISSEIGDRRRSLGRGAAIAALLFFVLFDAGRWVIHRRVLAQLEDRTYEDEPPLSAAAFPTPFSPLRWAAAVETRRKYLQLATDAAASVQWENAREYFKPAVTPAFDEVRKAGPFPYFLYFARFPVWSIDVRESRDGRFTRFDLSDLRFGSPGVGSFHCIAAVDAGGRVKGRWFSYGSGVELGNGE